MRLPLRRNTEEVSVVLQNFIPVLDLGRVSIFNAVSGPAVTSLAWFNPASLKLDPGFCPGEAGPSEPWRWELPALPAHKPSSWPPQPAHIPGGHYYPTAPSRQFPGGHLHPRQSPGHFLWDVTITSPKLLGTAEWGSTGTGRRWGEGLSARKDTF